MSAFVAPRPALRALLITIAAAFLLVSAPTPAFAHTRLISSDPGDGASLGDPPSSISLTFNENMKAEFSAVSVVGPDGANWQAGELSASGGVVSAPVKPLSLNGRYEVGYRVVSDDGHPVQGRIAFTLTASASAAAGATPTSSPESTAPAVPGSASSSAAAPETTAQQTPDDAGSPVWPWLVGVILLAGAGTIVALRLHRNDEGRDTDR